MSQRTVAQLTEPLGFTPPPQQALLLVHEVPVRRQPPAGRHTVAPEPGSLAVPAELGTVEWFGGGPGEAYPDSRAAVRVGRYLRTVDQLQTPYVYPQENGARTDVRWATLTGPDGRGLRITGDPTFILTVRRWTSEDLDAAKHAHQLRPRDQLYVNLDAAHHGIGTASCGPGVQPQYQLRPGPFRFGLTLGPA